MELDFAFPVAEGTVTGVRRVGNVQRRMIFAGEQVREICFERTVGAAETLVRVVPSFGFRVDGFLLEKRLPAFVPGFEPLREAFPMQFGQLKCKDAEFLCRFRDGVARDVLLDRLDLVELAELDGKTRETALEHRNDPFPPIDDEGGEGVSCREEGVQSLFVVHNLLRDDFLPIEVPAARTTHENAVAPSEERGVHGNDNGMFCRRLHLTRRSCVGIEIFSERLGMLAVLLAQLRVRLLVRRELVVGLRDPDVLLETSLLKLLPAIAAFVALSAPALTVFLCAVRSSVYSAKLAFLNLEKDKTAISVSL